MKKLLIDSFDAKNLLDLFKQEERPLSINEIRDMVEEWRSKKREIKKALRELIRDGSIVRLKNNRFGIPDEMNLMVGTLWCTRSGNGFVVSEKEGEKDVFVPSRYIENAMHGDRVVVRIERSSGGKREGRIVKVSERKTKTVTGFLRQHRELFFLTPDDERITAHFLVETGRKAQQLHNGDLVAAKVTGFPDGSDPECKVVKVFRTLDDAKKISEFVTYKSGLSSRFPKSVESEAKECQLLAAEKGRVDLRSTTHVTIDGEFAKDFDDAVYVEKSKKGYALYVSIADVSHYVPRDSALDREAYERGTSVYFPGSVIPMLPRKLSNDLCSLKPREDRMTVTAKLTYDTTGKLVEASFFPSIICSSRRLTYHQVEDALVHTDKKTRETLRDVMKLLEHMGELAKILKKRRHDRGNLDFDLPEPEVLLDIEGGVKDILRSERLFSQSIIEEFMIAANEAVARFIGDRKVPLIYRIHESPDKEKLIDFERLLRILSVPYKTDKKDRLPLQDILKSVQGKEHEFLINRILLKSMKQARYSALNKGHFGLGLDFYSHFTSPIRRYPDLICHRVLKKVIGEKTEGKPLYGEDELEAMAIHLSGRERAAMEAERETEDRIRVLFMKDRIGETYEGIISHITSYGFFVELFEVFVEGVVLLSTLHDDYYAFDEERFRLIGRKTHKVFRIGDHVRVRVVTADVEKNLLHFSLESSKKSRSSKSRKHR